MVQVHWIDAACEHAYLGYEPRTLGLEGEICCYNLVLNFRKIFHFSSCFLCKWGFYGLKQKYALSNQSSRLMDN
jgi:hypothetical protein